MVHTAVSSSSFFFFGKTNNCFNQNQEQASDTTKRNADNGSSLSHMLNQSGPGNAKMEGRQFLIAFMCIYRHQTWVWLSQSQVILPLFIFWVILFFFLLTRTCPPQRYSSTTMFNSFIFVWSPINPRSRLRRGKGKGRSFLRFLLLFATCKSFLVLPCFY